MLALGGAFWIGLGVGMAGQQGYWAASTIGMVVQIGGAVWLIWAAVRLRRRSGFQRAELRRLEGVAADQKRHILRWMQWTVLAQTLLGGLLVWLCVRAQAEHLIWAAIGTVVSLHFAPLGKIFHVRTYYVTAIAGTIVSVVGLAVSGAPWGVTLLGLGMAAVMWASACYVLLHADRIADRACTEEWAA